MHSVAVLGALVAAACTVSASQCDVDLSARQDCGALGTTQESCEASSCCWDQQEDGSSTPWCFKPGVNDAQYTSSVMTETATGYTGKLSLSQGGGSTYGNDIESLTWELMFEGPDYVRLRITDPADKRWEVPSSVVDRPEGVPAVPLKARIYDVKVDESPFSVTVTRMADGVVVLQTSPTLVYKDQYLQLTTLTDSTAKTYGIGETSRTNHALRADTSYTLFAADIPAANMYQNLYGSFPLYLQHVGGSVHGVLLFNSNGMDVNVNSDSITFKTIGGIIDLYAFVGPSGDNVVSQYTRVVGRSMMIPYWSLGFHNCKYGYTDVYQVEDVVSKYADAGIPLDSQWMDIDYMEEYRDFTSDATNFPYDEVKSFVDTLHDDGQRFVQIIDPGIEPHDDYAAYTRGIDMDVFVKDIQGNDFLGQVWPGPAVYPDFLHPDIDEYWGKEISDYHAKIPIDGLWIDMNEVANFCNIQGTEQVCENSAPEGCPAAGASQTDCCLVCSTVDSTNQKDFPPYSIGNSQGEGHLNTHTMAMSSTQYGNVSVYDSHNLYGLTEAISTNKALTAIRGERPFLVTRSSFVGSGKHTAKWTGDNKSSWDDLKSSIISVMDFNFFGIPMIGADICGFLDTTTEELCARWIELGAFYPFSRNHNALGEADQELYLWDSVTQASKRALGMRYRMLPYLYTLFYNSHTQGSTVVKPLWFNFLDDADASTIERQFMLGNAILVSPVLDEYSTSVHAYFPSGMWYNFETSAFDFQSTGEYKDIDTPLEATNVHIRGGSILPLQDASMTTTEGRKSPFTLFTALCEHGKAQGSLFWDNGVQVNLDNMLELNFEAEVSGSSGSFTSTVGENTYETDNIVGSVVVLGQNLATPTTVFIDGKQSDVTVSLDESKGSLTFSLAQPLTSGFKMTWE